jgi:hypothetical protein
MGFLVHKRTLAFTPGLKSIPVEPKAVGVRGAASAV